MDPPFHDRVHAGHSDVAAHDRDVGVGEDRVEQGRVLAVPILDQVFHRASGVLKVHHQAPGRLGNPAGGRMSGGAEDAYSAGGVFDDRKDVQPGAGHR
ncbi:hypothetical protein [Micromonospora sp. NPDC048830]|uniref:hypothetical protein n=1 Tax=Micromonospora sp. NPDC048830 TaxID=3364257 RepID=UPI00371BD51A